MKLNKGNPLIVGVISSRLFLNQFVEAEAVSTVGKGKSPRHQLPCDLLEIRLDRIWEPFFSASWRKSAAEEVRKEIAGFLEGCGGNFDFLFTLRHVSEGGACRWNSQQRCELLEPFLAAISAVDLELRFVSRSAVMREFVRKARRKGVVVILSYHNFRKTPSATFLKSRIDSMFRQRAGIAKIATLTNHAADIECLKQVLAAGKKTTPIALMGMGKLATESRLQLARSGSALVYGFLDQSQAPGQISASELKNLLK